MSRLVQHGVKERGRHVSDITWKSNTVGGLANNWIWEKGNGREAAARTAYGVTHWPAMGPSPEMEKTDGG